MSAKGKLKVNVTEKVDVTENVTENYRLDKGDPYISTTKMAEK